MVRTCLQKYRNKEWKVISKEKFPESEKKDSDLRKVKCESGRDGNGSDVDRHLAEEAGVSGFKSVTVSQSGVRALQREAY
jgi:hypothetical protein